MKRWWSQSRGCPFQRVVSGHRVHINSLGGLRTEGARFRGWSLNIGYILTQWVVSEQGVPVSEGGLWRAEVCNLNNAGL